MRAWNCPDCGNRLTQVGKYATGEIAAGKAIIGGWEPYEVYGLLFECGRCNKSYFANHQGEFDGEVLRGTPDPSGGGRSTGLLLRTWEIFAEGTPIGSVLAYNLEEAIIKADDLYGYESLRSYLFLRPGPEESK